MKNTLMGTEIVPTEGFHLVQKLYSFLDIPGRSPGHLQSTDLGKGSKEGSEVRAGPTVRKFGRQFCWQEELANARYGVSPLVALETRAVECPQGAAQCGDLVGLSEAFSPQWGEAGQPVRLGLFGFQIGPSRRGQLPFQTEDGGFPVSNGRTTQAVPGIVQTQC